MKAIVFDEEISFENVKEPEITHDTDVKIKVSSVGLCGSDIHKILGEKTPSNYLKTKILGHEVSGVVVDIGKKVSTLKAGDRVCVEPIFPRRYIENYQFFNDTLFLGRDIQGAFSEYIVVPAESVFKVSPNLSLDIACFADVVAVALHGIHRCITAKKNNIAVIGDGPIALATIALCHLLNVSKNIVCLGKISQKLEVAKKLGATSTYLCDLVPKRMENSFDVVFEAVGGSQSDTLEQAISLVSPIANIGVFGVFNSTFQHQLQLRPAFYKEVSIIGLNSYSIFLGKREFQEALELLETNADFFAQIISLKKPLSDFENVIDLIKHKDEKMPIKAIFNP